jgi:hypothetical protein
MKEETCATRACACICKRTLDDGVGRPPFTHAALKVVPALHEDDSVALGAVTRLDDVGFALLEADQQVLPARVRLGVPRSRVEVVCLRKEALIAIGFRRKKRGVDEESVRARARKRSERESERKREREREKERESERERERSRV